MDIEKSLEKLKQSPLYAISLSSKELFHSNFWAWLIEYNQEFAKAFFLDIDFNKNLTVSREEKNRDLTIHYQNKEYVIENKIKSMPNIEQLKKYGCDKGLLAGVVGLDNLPENWNFKSYKEIGLSISEINEKYKNDKWYFLIQEYANMIIELENILTWISKFQGNKLISNAQIKTNQMLKKFEEIRFDDVIKKIKANELVEFLNKTIKPELDKQLCDSEFELQIGSSYSKGSALVDVRILKNAGTEKEVCIGIQIQDAQYRYNVVRKSGTLNFKNENALNVFFDEFCGYGWFENYDKSLKKIKNKNSSMRESFCKYENKKDNSKFIYQYYNLNEEDLSFENLSNQIKKDMLLAIEITKKIND